MGRAPARKPQVLPRSINQGYHSLMTIVAFGAVIALVIGTGYVAIFNDIWPHAAWFQPFLDCMKKEQETQPDPDSEFSETTSHVNRKAINEHQLKPGYWRIKALNSAVASGTGTWEMFLAVEIV